MLCRVANNVLQPASWGLVGEVGGCSKGGERMPTWRILVLFAAVLGIFLLGGWALQVRAQAAQDEERDRRGVPGDVRLRISGDEGTRFSGACTVGEDEREISGQVPQRYDLKGRDLACEIRKEGAESGELMVVLRGENTHFAQRIEGGDPVIRLVYEEGNVSSSTVSSGEGSSSQELSVSSSQTMSNFSSAQDDDGESLADRIIRKVNRDIAERMEP